MKKKFPVHGFLRFLIQLAFFIFLPALFSSAFAGARYLAEQIHKQELISWNPFLTALVILSACTILLGRFFCGYACIFGSIGDWLYTCSAFVQGKLLKRTLLLPDKVIRALQYLKYFVLIGILAACLTGTYHYISAADPWELLASFWSSNINISSKTMYAAILLGLILIGMCLAERFFCQFLCPMGAIFALLPILPYTTFNRDSKECIKGCTICKKTCPASVTLGEPESRYGDCFQCGKCSIKCPKENVRLGYKKFKGTEVALTLAKAALLFAVCYALTNS